MLPLCSMSWDHIVMAIRSTTTKFNMNEVVELLLSKEMWSNTYEFAKETLADCGISKEKEKKKDKTDERSRSKSRGRSKSLGKSKEKCSNYDKIIHFHKDCKKEKKKKKKKVSSNLDLEKSPQNDGEAFFAALVAHTLEDLLLIKLGASFYMASHRVWFLNYEEYDGGKVSLSDDSHF